MTLTGAAQVAVPQQCESPSDPQYGYGAWDTYAPPTFAPQGRASVPGACNACAHTHPERTHALDRQHGSEPLCSTFRSTHADSPVSNSYTLSAAAANTAHAQHLCMQQQQHMLPATAWQQMRTSPQAQFDD